MKIDLSAEERQALLWVLDQVSLKVGPQNLVIMQALVSVEKKILENNTKESARREPSPK